MEDGGVRVEGVGRGLPVLLWIDLYRPGFDFTFRTLDGGGMSVMIMFCS